ncbi:uncharacterized protein ASPGLDRAFT_41288 [Aspergillus glaucus CBS 516.65]|uniref:Uncharacterized protein n=1 Tax=Aspergillus glaucus CBS 516.65 TaxID=1160497 RepID=A0A1L9VZH3_ASPGL|nr:hypothetical protein ASPGLDRAFT_41288 [Aspergillus glaucus CBS 516.65]OJJ89324.1 hypothetical protein ASPGLDRAFT_41288 [Aspergillus glaucus CBS 516.65]
MPKPLRKHPMPPRHTPKYLRLPTKHRNRRSPPTSSYASLRVTQPAELAHTPPWTS